MNVDTRLFHSIIARRFFALFVLSALAPIVILAAVTYWHVSNELLQQSRDRLEHAAKSVTLSVAERLQFVSAELESLALSVAPPDFGLPAGENGERVHELFDGLLVGSADGEVTAVFGEALEPPELTGDQLDHLKLGKSLLLSLGGEDDNPPILLMERLLDPSNPQTGVILGVISPIYLWGTDGGHVLPYGIDLCAYDDARRLLYGSFEGCRVIAPQVAAKTVGKHRGELEVRFEGQDFVAPYLNLFLEPQFHAETWSFVPIQSEDEALTLWDKVFDLRDNFFWVFTLIVLVCLWVVLLLSSFAIRQNLVPLDRLTEGTRRIAERDFSTRVEVDSGDEFDDLAEAFNNMSDRLQRQFKALTTNSEIQRAILSAIDTTSIVETATAGALDTIDCDLVCVGVRGEGETNEIGLFYAVNGGGEAVRGQTGKLSVWDLEVLSDGEDALILRDEDGASGLLQVIPAGTGSMVVAFPILLGSRLTAVLCIGRVGGGEFSSEELAQSRQIADQVAVALSNASLIDELKVLTWGTLEALARAIDAKSPWTAGHSGRVTAMSLKIARALGRSRRELDVMHRGALLHDIGKLGISAKVLDKQGRLEPEEVQHVMEHPSIGGRILDPISAFSEIMPIVTDHHEWFDGTGYPNGLAGEEIHINARILAVADTYDAMTSDRPYRKGLDVEVAIEEICNQAGRQFDPKVVDAFLGAMGRDRDEKPMKPGLDLLDDVAGRSA